MPAQLRQVARGQLFDLGADVAEAGLDVFSDFLEGAVLELLAAGGGTLEARLIVGLDLREPGCELVHRRLELLNFRPGSFVQLLVKTADILLDGPGELLAPLAGPAHLLLEAAHLLFGGFDVVSNLHHAVVGMLNGTLLGILESFDVSRFELVHDLRDAALELLQLRLRGFDAFSDCVDVLGFLADAVDVLLRLGGHLHQLIERGVVVADARSDPLYLRSPFIEPVLEALDSVEHLAGGLLMDLQLDTHVLDLRRFLLDD